MILAALAAAAFLIGSVATAQEQEDEIVVTGSRFREAYEDFKVPHVSIARRADAITVSLTVTSDTRDRDARVNEVRAALREIDRRARGGDVTLTVIDDDIVRPFSLAAAERSIHPSNRPDTSQVSLILRTAISRTDTLESARARFVLFRGNLSAHGRVEYGMSSSPELTLINPSQYRTAIITAISTDVRAVTQSLGSGYAARIEGLEQQIAWRRTGDLELRLFIPYRLEIRPVGGAS
jgi:hypothetical protein